MKRLLTTGVLFLLAPAIGATSFSVLFHVEDIEGESLSARHSRWIEVENFSFGASKASTTNAAFSPLVLTKRIDKSSPLLFQSVATGKHLENGVIDVVRTDPTGVRFLQLKLGDFSVSSVQQSGSSGGIPIETVSLNFASVKWTYTEVATDVRPLRDVVCSWNVSSNSGSGGEIVLDRDNDGLPDDYEQRYGLRVDVPDATGDFDGDGMANIDEFRAGTVPNQTDSVFEVSGARDQSGAATLNWESSAAKTYRLMGAASPAAPFEFIRFLTEEEAAAGQLQLQTTGDFQFFILEVE